MSNLAFFPFRKGIWISVDAESKPKPDVDLKLKSLRTRARKAFYTLVDASGALSSLRQEAQTQFPDDEKKAKQWWNQQAKKEPSVAKFLKTFDLTGKNSTSFLNAIREVVFGSKTVEVGWKTVNRKIFSAFVEKEREQARKVFNQLGITDEIIKALLPKSFFVSAEPSGEVTKEFELFGNAKKTIEAKRRSMATIIGNWNKLVAALKQDLASNDPVTHLKALVTSIILQTGFRVGEGKTTLTDEETGKVIKDEHGNPIKVQTTGATSLKQEHVDFVRDDFAHIEFPGKAGTTNISELTDPELVNALRNQMKAVAGNTDGYIFVTHDGKRISAKMVNNYLKKVLNSSDVSAHNLRHLRGTQTFYSALRTDQHQLAAQLRTLKDVAYEDLEKQIVSKVVEFMRDAARKAQTTLSHEDVETTIEYYINPRVVLEFLTQIGLPRALEVVIGDSGGLKVKFDPMEFYNTMLAQFQETAVSASVLRLAKTTFYFGDRFVDYDVDEAIAELEEA